MEYISEDGKKFKTEMEAEIHDMAMAKAYSIRKELREKNKKYYFLKNKEDLRLLIVLSNLWYGLDVVEEFEPEEYPQWVKVVPEDDYGLFETKNEVVIRKIDETDDLTG